MANDFEQLQQTIQELQNKVADLEQKLTNQSFFDKMREYFLNYIDIFRVKGGKIQSSNFVEGSAGWRFTHNTLEINSGIFRSDIVIGSGDNVFKADSNGIYLGDAVFADAPFRVSMAGALTASSVTITGGTISIGSGNSIFKADSNGIYLGNSTFASAPFRVTPAGALTATNATITGTITGSTITGGTIRTSDTTTRVELSGANNTLEIYANDILRARVAGGGFEFFEAVTELSSGVIYGRGVQQVAISPDFGGGGDEFIFGITEMLPSTDNALQLGTSSFRWKDVRSVLINGADYGFANGWILREYPATKEDVHTKSDAWMRENANLGIQILDEEANLIAVIHKDGHIYCNGIKSLKELRAN